MTIPNSSEYAHSCAYSTLLNMAVCIFLLTLIRFIKNLWLRESQVVPVATKPLPHGVPVATKPLPQVVPVATMPVQRIITVPPCCSKDVMCWLIRVLGNHPSLTLLNISCHLSWSFHSKGATFKYEGYTYFHNDPHYVMWIAIQSSLKYNLE